MGVHVRSGRLTAPQQVGLHSLEMHVHLLCLRLPSATGVFHCRRSVSLIGCCGDCSMGAIPAHLLALAPSPSLVTGLPLPKVGDIDARGEHSPVRCRHEGRGRDLHARHLW